jgi:hypothetical protein
MRDSRGLLTAAAEEPSCCGGVGSFHACTVMSSVEATSGHVSHEIRKWGSYFMLARPDERQAQPLRDRRTIEGGLPAPFSGALRPSIGMTIGEVK